MQGRQNTGWLTITGSGAVSLARNGDVRFSLVAPNSATTFTPTAHPVFAKIDILARTIITGTT